MAEKNENETPEAGSGEQPREAEEATYEKVKVTDREGNEFEVPTGFDGTSPQSPDNPSAKAFWTESDKEKAEAQLEDGVRSEGDDYGVDMLSLEDRGFSEQRETTEADTPGAEATGETEVQTAEDQDGGDNKSKGRKTGNRKS